MPPCSQTGSETSEDGRRLRDAGVLYCPDYVVNAGGVLSVVPPGVTYSRQKALRRADGIAETLARVLCLADDLGIPTHAAADRIAEDLLAVGLAGAVARHKAIAE